MRKGLPAERAETVNCKGCRMIHVTSLRCEVVRARVEAMIIEPGEELGEEELAGVDRIELIACLRLRGLALTMPADGAPWQVVELLARDTGCGACNGAGCPTCCPADAR